MHQLSGSNEKIMVSQIKQRCWKGMRVGGKGVTGAGGQRLGRETADNQEVGELPTNGFPCSLASLFLLVFAGPCKVRPRAGAAKRAAGDPGTGVTLLPPPTVTASAPGLLPTQTAIGIAHAAVCSASPSLQPDPAKYLRCAQL